MALLRGKLKNKIENIRARVVDDEQRRDLILVWFNVLFSIVAGFMTVVNLVTQKWILLASTLAFTLACLFNYWLYYRGNRCRRAARFLFLAEGVLLCGFFCISGTPEGFSALWTCFIPSFSFSLLGRKKGCIYSGIGLAMVILIFWTPFGRNLLQYAYTSSFMLRFPMIYLAFFVLAMFLEFVREETQRQLREMEQRFHHLYRHDALTGALSRYGFNEKMDELFPSAEAKTLTLMIVDLDLFKRINDTYGHDAGDQVLRFTAELLEQMAEQAGVVCRWGGEEFTLLLPNIREPERFAEQIRRQVEQAVIWVGTNRIQVTVTVGVCTVGDRKGVSIGDLVRAADNNLYAAKAAGRNRVCASFL